ncbi:hypothetical protein Hanom_Chr04g00378751 [Helianthus anomalus]
MELTSRMKMARIQTFRIQMRKNKPLDERRKTGQTSGTKMAFYSRKIKNFWANNVSGQSDPTADSLPNQPG